VPDVQGHPDAPTREGRPSLEALTGLRILAAAWVVLFHYGDVLIGLAPWLAPARTFFRAGYHGVDLFFPLSGFVLAYNYAEPMRTWSGRAWLDFVRNRIARVWPVHVVTLCIAAVLAAVTGVLGTADPVSGHRWTATAFVQNLFMVHHWFTDRPSFNGPAWSISDEWFAYLLAPVLFLALGRLRRGGSLVALAALSYAVMLAAFALFALPNGNLEHAFYVRIGCEFVGGAALAVAWQRGRMQVPRLATPVAVLVVALTAATPLAAGGHYWMAPLLAILVWALAGGGASAPGVLAHLLARRGVVLAGEASYCLYMTHWLLDGPIRGLGDWGGDSGWTALVAFVLIISILGAAAWLLHIAVERPARRLLRAPSRH
jgi:peptidoglycan/LPS O-acetylase OafA/YrhL